MKEFSFEIEKRLPGHLGRAGLLKTPHGDIATPAFIPVGTKATVKGVTPEMLVTIGAEAVLGNTYHLFLEPGEDVIQEAGGMGKFMGWNAPTFTDSGGFQVFSLGVGFEKGISKFVKKEKSPEAELVPYNKEFAKEQGKLAIIDDDGVTFTSHLDGSLHRFTPERSMEIQHSLGADIIFAFDECTAPDADESYQKEALARTHAWAKRSLLAHKRNIEGAKKQALYGITQGGVYPALREESAKVLSTMDFDGFGIGGSFSKKDLDPTLALVNAILPEEKPRHLLGIGSEPTEILESIESGIDTFDCVAPTRLARTGSMYTANGIINLRNARYRSEHHTLSECGCPTCKTFTLAYLAHLFRSNEMLGPILLSVHNLYFMIDLVRGARAHILSDTFRAYKEGILSRWR